MDIFDTKTLIQMGEGLIAIKQKQMFDLEKCDLQLCEILRHGQVLSQDLTRDQRIEIVARRHELQSQITELTESIRIIGYQNSLRRRNKRVEWIG